MRVVLALGGNAMTAPDGSATPAAQIAAVEVAMRAAARLVAAGHELVITHGNGPQVGNLLVKNELAAHVVRECGLDRGQATCLILDRLDEARVLVFLQNSQGRGIGSILAQSLNAFGMQGWTADLQDSTDDILRATVEHKINVWFGDAITIYRATRVLEKQAVALNPRGELYTANTIAERLSVRNFMEELRGAGVQTGGPATLHARDRQAFAAQLDRWLAQRR